MRGLRTVAAVGLLAGAAAGCSSVGSAGGMGDVFGDGTSVYGEVRSVDTRRGRIQVREERGRDRTVRVDNRTRVVYRDRQYPVSSLERGDQVRMRVEYDRSNVAWADRIEVRSSARRSDRDRDRRGPDRRRDRVGERDRGEARGSARIERLDGRVQGIDVRRGYFTLAGTRDSRVVVYVPRDARREDVRRFERLRRGDRVRADVRSRGRDQAELVRFR